MITKIFMIVANASLHSHSPKYLINRKQYKNKHKQCNLTIPHAVETGVLSCLRGADGKGIQTHSTRMKF